MKSTLLQTAIFFHLIIINCFSVNAQWTIVAENITPVSIAISPEYHLDQTVYVIDDERKLMISETGGSVWVTLYEAVNPQDPAQAILDIVISPNFKNDNALIMVHKDGTARLSFNRGQHWINLPVPDGTTGIVFSPRVAEDYKLFCITGAYGPVKFYRSVNGGAAWTLVSDITLGGGFYSRIRNSSDTAAIDFLAIQYDLNSLFISDDGGVTWQKSFEALVLLNDFTLSPKFSQDQTVFAADASDIWKNSNGGSELNWIKTASFTGSSGIKLAVSPTYDQDHTLFAAVDQVGILRSIDGGESFMDFNEGFTSSYPVSIAISQNQPVALFAGSQAPGGGPGKLFKNQTVTGTEEFSVTPSLHLRNQPNPFSRETVVTFELDETSRARLVLYDLTGKKIEVLADRVFLKGIHNIHLSTEKNSLRPGLYFCRLQTDLQSESLKLVVGN